MDQANPQNTRSLNCHNFVIIIALGSASMSFITHMTLYKSLIVTGGAVFIAVDFAGLQEYIRITDTVRTLDDFIEILVDSGIISDEVTERCQLEATLTTTRNIQITLSAQDGEDPSFCSQASERLAAAINDPSSVSEESLFVQVPEVLQFASAAIAATNELTSNNGAPLLNTLSYLVLMLVNIIVLIIF